VDCELVRSGFPGQPVAAYSALAFVIAGVALIAHRRPPGARIYGLLLVAVGASSFMFHALSTSGVGESIAILALVTWTIAWARFEVTPAIVRRWALGAAALAALVWLLPDGRHVLTALAIAAIVAALAPLRDATVRIAFALMAVAVLVYLLSRTGGLLCAPASLFQGHALWHVLSAVSLWMVGEALARASRPPVLSRSTEG